MLQRACLAVVLAGAIDDRAFLRDVISWLLEVAALAAKREALWSPVLFAPFVPDEVTD